MISERFVRKQGKVYFIISMEHYNAEVMFEEKIMLLRKFKFLSKDLFSKTGHKASSYD
jgi:hypothetical protein